MININKGEKNTIILRLYDVSGNHLYIIETDTIIESDTIISELVDAHYTLIFNNGKEIVLTDTSKYPEVYNKFELIEGTDITLDEGQGDYKILLNSSILVSSGVYTVDGPIYKGKDSITFKDKTNTTITFKER